MSGIKIGCSPLTGKIYAGKVLKSGLWASGKVDVTDEAVKSVAEHLIIRDQRLEFDYNGKRFSMKAVEIPIK